MKKILFSLILILTLCVASLPAYASYSTEPSVDLQLQNNETITYLSDDSYFISVIKDENSLMSTKSASTITKSKTSVYYDSNGTAKWYVKVTGTFTYGNGKSECTRSSISSGSYDKSSWKIINASSSKSKNTAIATASANHYLSGKYINTISKRVTLTCSTTGQFS